MQLAFCFHSPSPQILTSSPNFLISAKQRRSSSKPRQGPRSPRAKRPRSPPNSTSGFAPPSDASPLSSPPSPDISTSSSSSSSPSSSPPVETNGRDLSKRDASGISLEDRLKEEIQHPLRKPKLTLFGTLAFSATLGMFFAIARASKDGFTQVAQNVAVDIAAISLFSYLAWREVQFGRRSLNSIAGKPQARDLRVLQLNDTVKFGTGKGTNLGALMNKKLVIVAGKSVDVEKYLERVEESDQVNLVAYLVDRRGNDEIQLDGVAAIASGEADNAKDWVAWLGDAVPPRRNVALFTIQKGDRGIQAANAYVVAAGLPSEVPLPLEATLEVSEE